MANVDKKMMMETAAKVIAPIEVAPGIDIEKDIMNQIECRVPIDEKVKTMDPRIFNEAKMKLEL